MPSHSMPYAKDPLFQSMLSALQKGEWSTGIRELERLIQNYPYSADLQNMLEETRLRSRIDDYEQDEQRMLMRRRMLRTSIRGAAMIGLVLVLIFITLSSLDWAVSSWQRVLADMTGQMNEIEIAATFRQGQNLMAAGRYQEALDAFLAVKVEEPGFEGLDYYLQESGRLLEIDQKYLNAKELLAAGDTDTAMRLFKEIEAVQPSYRDVQYMIEDLGSAAYLDGIIYNSSVAAEEGNWELAVNGLESVRKENPDYRTDDVEEQLFKAYIGLATATLEQGSDSLDNLEIAENYFRKALGLRPQDAQAEAERARIRDLFRQSLAQKYLEAATAVLIQEADSLIAQAQAEDYFRRAQALMPGDATINQYREMAQNFLVAQTRFFESDWDAVIEALEPVYEVDPDYALGVTRLTLFEAYLQRGKEYQLMTEFTDALADYQRAAELTASSPNPLNMLYEVRQRIAEAYAALGEYERASLAYQALVTDMESAQVDPFAIALNTSKLQQALNYIEIGYYKTAYRYFRESLPPFLPVDATVVVTIGSDENILIAANRQGTTIEHILYINQLSGIHKLTGKPLNMPVP